MGPEQIELSAKEREGLKVLHEVEQGHQHAPAAGAHPTPGGNSQRAPDAHGGDRSHGQLARPALGVVARRCLRRITRGARGDRTVSGRFALVALPRPLPALHACPGGATIGNSLRPAAWRSRRCQNQSTPADQNQLHPLPIIPGRNFGSGHFYPAETRTFLLCVDSSTLA